MSDVYEGITGYLYECTQLNDIKNPTNIIYTYVYENPVQIDKCTVFKDIYIELLDFEKQGNLIVNRYESLSTKGLSAIHKMIATEIIKYDLKRNPNISYSLFIKKNFSHVWDEVI